MKGNPNRWEKLGRIIGPRDDVEWMSTWAGPACAVQVEDSSEFHVFMAGRDKKNRSQIGTFNIDIRHPTLYTNLSEAPVLSFSTPGAFDENGVSYPWVVRSEKSLNLYFNGWMPTILTPFQIHLGLARSVDGGVFRRVSRAPILERNDDDYLSIGSVCVLPERDRWRMWYTSFLRWGTTQGEHKHYYTIKYAQSFDGLIWHRDNITCIPFQDQSEFSICRPSVLLLDGLYHMWYSYRGDQYKIGYAYSGDGVHWNRADSLVNIELSETGWDSIAMCYSYVFRHAESLYMLYCGNNYGREGVGIARLRLNTPSS